MIRKNKKFIDPRYFMNEKMEKPPEVVLFLKEIRSMGFLFEQPQHQRNTPEELPWEMMQQGAQNAAQNMEAEGIEEDDGPFMTALQKIANVAGFVDPCVYADKNRGRLEEELTDVEEALLRIKGLEAEEVVDDLEDLSKTLAMIGAFPIIAALMGELAIVPAKILFAGTSAVAGQIASTTSHLPFDVGPAIASKITPDIPVVPTATFGGMASSLWYWLGEAIIFLSIMVYVYKLLLEWGVLCKMKEAAVSTASLALSVGIAVKSGIEIGLDIISSGAKDLFNWAKEKATTALRPDTPPEEIQEIMYEFKRLGIFPYGYRDQRILT